MSHPIVRVEHLGKRYQIGAAQRRAGSFREALAGMAYAPVERLRRLAGRAPEEEQFWALDDVSFEVERGEAIGIIGRNGAGKSTLLKVLSRITEPTRGRVQLWGRVASLLEVGTGFHPELTGRENIYLNGAILGMSRAEIKRKFDEIVAFAEIEQFLDTQVKHYSSGMYMRLAFAVAAHLEPEILIVDEVLAVGDAQFQKKCLGKMEDVTAHEGRTVLFVSHNMGAISQLCRRAVLLVSGKVVEIGPAREVIHTYYRGNVEQDRVDPSPFRVGGLGTEIHFISIKQMPQSAAGATGQGVFLYNEPLRFVAQVHCTINARELSIGTGVFTDTGTPVGTQFSRDTFDARAGVTLEIEIVLPPFNLAPGHYTLGVSIGRGNLSSGRHDNDIILGFPAFQVASFGSDGDSIVAWPDTWGSLVLPRPAVSAASVSMEIFTNV
ncbi:MAG TPA: polysaccharide ABC transporter ATP-binding protein [Pirellulales bacterium]|jgi:lipopolysaccharide transport system ATP-binding protein|nr:polysaccharide ABC transporter ATP-binding protein [Pirellulales bacterium]